MCIYYTWVKRTLVDEIDVDFVFHMKINLGFCKMIFLKQKLSQPDSFSFEIIPKTVPKSLLVENMLALTISI